MKSNRFIWGLTVILVLITIAVSFAPISSYSQKETSKEQENAGFGDLSKYPTVEYNAPEPEDAAEREERKLKNKRYDKYLLVSKEPHPETAVTIASHAEPLPSAIPFAESNLIVTGEIINSKASLSNNKSGVYSEYTVRILTILKEDNQKKWQTNELITIDRAGGVVQYPSGQKVLYMNNWQKLPEVNARYVLFLNNEDAKNPNYKLLTAYQLENKRVTALDNHPDFREFDGKSETDFINRILKNK